MAAQGAIVGIGAPSRAEAGQEVAIMVSVTNVGDVFEFFRVDLTDRDTGERVQRTDFFNVHPGEVVHKQLDPLVMPNRRWRLNVGLWRTGIVEPFLDDYADFNVALAGAVPNWLIWGILAVGMGFYYFSRRQPL